MRAVYIHIPFCQNICAYCDFCKVLKNNDWIEKYLIALKKEIDKYYTHEKVSSLYFGGGTPSTLNLNQLKKLFDITKVFDLDKNAEITFECNCEDLTEEKLEFLSHHVNRLSVGVQSFNSKITDALERKMANINNILLAKKYFKNINIDLMYGFNNESLKDFEKDVNMFLELNVPHLSAYNLILEPHTKLFINNYQTDDDDKFERCLEEKIKRFGYHRYEISNYAKEGYESKHNLTYWNNQNYYGFGLGASGYIDNKRYDNTRSLNKYLKGQYRYESHTLDLNETLQNEFILGLRKIKGINKKEFREKYKFNIKDIDIVNELLENKMLLEDDNIYINPKYINVSNEILVKFLENIY